MKQKRAEDEGLTKDEKMNANIESSRRAQNKVLILGSISAVHKDHEVPLMFSKVTSTHSLLET